MNMRLVAAGQILLFAGCSSRQGDGTPTPSKPSFGYFEGTVDAAWDDDGRSMTLNKDFAYVDPMNERWLAPVGSSINGATIPTAFWSVIGGPFEGLYRKASVVHDVACVEMNESWKAVHLMFYNACRCGGVSKGKVRLMFWAVYRYGPRWKEVKETRVVTRIVNGEEVQEEIVVSRNVRDDPLPLDASVVERAKEFFDSNDPSLDEIESISFQ